jgi:FAD-linked sulfhydryl oxidase
MFFDPSVWGPHYWFFLHTVAESYPETPNAVAKRKYYDLIQNMPLFIPIPEIGNKFSELLDKYPVSPYLDSRESFVKWMHFIHNKVNHHLGKLELSLPQSLEKYRDMYKPRPLYLVEQINMRKHYLHAIVIGMLLFAIYTWYN